MTIVGKGIYASIPTKSQRDGATMDGPNGMK